ncbi:MAG: gliding motility-associated-like protein [Flavobacteriaceae bacterium]|jgi:gliding motility-associated-like protein
MKTLLSISLVFVLSTFISEAQTTLTFPFTGAPQTWTVPSCVTAVNYTVAGAQGGGAGGGQGAVITGTIAVTPGDVFTFLSGGASAGTAGGYGGGGEGQLANTAIEASSGGGGGSTLLVNGVPITIAGGGGGTGGGTSLAIGGNGGCATGFAGTSPFGQGGSSGTQVAGGLGGPPWVAAGNSGSAGSIGQGGAGATDPCFNVAPGGGGGGGYYGGGGGGSDCFGGAPYGGGSGGGGSSLVPAGAACAAGTNTGNGFITITFIGGLLAVASNTGPYCEGELIQLNSSGGSIYNWTGPNGYTSNLQNPMIAVSAVNMSGTYQVIVTDIACADIDTATTDVLVSPIPYVDPIIDQSICAGETILQIDFTGIVPLTAYSWTNTNINTGMALNGTDFIASFVGTAVGAVETSVVTIIPSTAFCSGPSEDFTITVWPAPSINVGVDSIICQNGEATLNATGVGVGAPFTYHWDHTTNTGATQIEYPTTTDFYPVYVENQYGCISTSDSILITVLPPLSGTITPWDTVCPGYGTSISATSTGGLGQPYTFTWSTSEIFTGIGAHTIDVAPASTTSYTVTVTDGCESTPLVLSTNVRVAPVPVPLIDVLNPEQCEPAIFDIVNVTDPALNQYTYWLVNGTDQYLNQDTIITQALMAGQYDVQLIVTSFEGCIDSTTFTDILAVDPKPIADFRYSPNPVLMFNTNVRFINYSTNGYTYQWYFDGGIPSQSTQTNVDVIFPDGISGRYDVTLITTSELGCTDTMIHELIVFPEILIYAPNTFTPDGDEHNQSWQLYMEGIDIYDFELLIFNRWGEVVWESHDISVGWDGTYGGQPVQSGNYTWIVRTKGLLDDGKYTYNGHINLLR